MWLIVICIICNIHAISNEEQICKENVEQKGSRIDPCGTPKLISIHVLYELFILVLCFLLNK